MLLIKVGKHEHLNQFLNGIVYFNPLDTFRNDGTCFRGDQYEGKVFIDTSKGFWINGTDISQYIAEATQTFVGSENVLIFCASIIDDTNSKPIPPNGIDFSDDFYNTMRKFGDYAVVFDSKELVKNIREALSDKKCTSAWGPVCYCDKRNSLQLSKTYHDNEDTFGEATIYFLKDENYRAQNEWRYTIDYINSDSPLKKNANGSLSLKINPVHASDIIDLRHPDKR